MFTLPWVNSLWSWLTMCEANFQFRRTTCDLIAVQVLLRRNCANGFFTVQVIRNGLNRAVAFVRMGMALHKWCLQSVTMFFLLQECVWSVAGLSWGHRAGDPVSTQCLRELQERDLGPRQNFTSLQRTAAEKGTNLGPRSCAPILHVML